MAKVINGNGTEIDFDAAVVLMDDDLREAIEADSEQAFIEIYAAAHIAKFGEDFTPYAGGAW